MHKGTSTSRQRTAAAAFAAAPHSAAAGRLAAAGPLPGCPLRCAIRHSLHGLDHLHQAKAAADRVLASHPTAEACTACRPPGRRLPAPADHGPLQPSALAGCSSTSSASMQLRAGACKRLPGRPVRAARWEGPSPGRPRPHTCLHLLLSGAHHHGSAGSAGAGTLHAQGVHPQSGGGAQGGGHGCCWSRRSEEHGAASDSPMASGPPPMTRAG